MMTYPLALPKTVQDKCTDPELKCINGTCCKTFDGKFGCCPFTGGQCCADGRHCCPKNLKCDVEMGRCVKKNSDFPSVHSNQFCLYFKVLRMKLLMCYLAHPSQSTKARLVLLNGK